MVKVWRVRSRDQHLIVEAEHTLWHLLMLNGGLCVWRGFPLTIHCVYTLWLWQHQKAEHIRLHLTQVSPSCLPLTLRWRALPATIAPTPWSPSGICRWSSPSVTTATAGSRPRRRHATWQRCLPSSPRRKRWRETSMPATTVTVSATLLRFKMVSLHF